MHKINCPICCAITTPDKVSFSITELLETIKEKSLDHYTNGVSGVIDEKNVRLLLDSQDLWNMTWEEICDCLNGNGEFVLKGENFFKRFGPDVRSMFINLESLSKDAIKNYKYNQPLLGLIDKIKSKISDKSRANLPKNIDSILADLIMYAQSDATLVQFKIEQNWIKDDLGNDIITGIHTAAKDVICKNKRCPECGSILSNLAGKYEEKIISFIGTPAAGKTAYLAAVITKLQNSGGFCDIYLEFDFTSYDYRNFDSRCLKPYSRGFAITKTPEDSFPQISIVLRNGKTDKKYLYTFVDIPGEIFADGSSGVDQVAIHTKRGIIKNSDIIWYCVSAKQLFDSSIGDKPDEMTDIQQLDQNMGIFVNSMFGESEKKPVVLVILTKSDLLTATIDRMKFTLSSPEQDAIYKDYYFKIIAPASADWSSMSSEGGRELYTSDGTINYTKLMNISKKTRDFICENGKGYSSSFFSNLSNHFQKEAVPCFSQASYGRDSVNSFTTEGAAEFLLSHLDALEATRDRVELKRIVGEDTERAFRNKEQYIIEIRGQDDIAMLQKLHGKYNPSKPFGIFPIIDWTLAYTGFFRQHENDAEFEELQCMLAGEKQEKMVEPPLSEPPKWWRFIIRQ